MGCDIRAHEVHHRNPIYHENYDEGAFQTNYNNMKSSINPKRNGRKKSME
jgi:hypothetical protein